MEGLRRTWATSSLFRIVSVLALVYVALRLVMHGAYLAMLLSPNGGMMPDRPGWTGAGEEPMVPVDLQVYLDATRNLLRRENLYLQGPVTRLEDLYQYPPGFALAFAPFLRLSATSVSVVHTLLHIAAYLGLYVAWYCIYRDLGIGSASKAMVTTVPLWFVFSAFWSDLTYLNIYVPMALLSTLLIRSVLRQELAWSVLWTSLILHTKPQWAFAVALPLLLGHQRFFLKLVGWSIVAYAAIVLSTMIAVGPSYVGRQYADYTQLLRTLPARFPWRGPEAPYLGYNHSIKQIIIYLLGESPGAFRLATATKLVLLAPLGLVSWRYGVATLRGSEVDASSWGIDIAFALYLGAFIWLDMVWEVTLGIAVFGYLLATGEDGVPKGLVWAGFMPYALIDLWRLLSFLVFGLDVIAPGPYVLTDPSIYLPVAMMAILFFYAVLIRRLWVAAPTTWEARAC